MNKLSQKQSGFTLIELIAVMGLLATMLVISAPKLSGFIKGRSLKEETRRFLELTNYARSQAISQSVPMEIWIDPELRKYGLRVQTGFQSLANIDFGQHIEFEFENYLTIILELNEPENEGLGIIRFNPEGSFDFSEITDIRIEQNENKWVRIRPAEEGYFLEQTRETLEEQEQNSDE